MNAEIYRIPKRNVSILTKNGVITLEHLTFNAPETLGGLMVEECLWHSVEINTDTEIFACFINGKNCQKTKTHAMMARAHGYELDDFENLLSANLA